MEKIQQHYQKRIWQQPCIQRKIYKKIKSYNGKINTNFYNNKIPKEGFWFICLSVTLIDSVNETAKNYQSVTQVLLK